MINLSTIETAVFAWVKTVTSLPDTSIVFEIQNIPHGKHPAIYIQLVSFIQIHNSFFKEPVIEVVGDKDLVTTWEFMAQLQGFGRGSKQHLLNLKNSLNSPVTHTLLFNSGIVTFNDNSPVSDISGVDGTENEERATWTTPMRVVGVDSAINLGVIEHTSTEGKLTSFKQTHTINLDVP